MRFNNRIHKLERPVIFSVTSFSYHSCRCIKSNICNYIVFKSIRRQRGVTTRITMTPGYDIASIKGRCRESLFMGIIGFAISASLQLYMISTITVSSYVVLIYYLQSRNCQMHRFSMSMLHGNCINRRRYVNGKTEIRHVYLLAHNFYI